MSAKSLWLKKIECFTKRTLVNRLFMWFWNASSLYLNFVIFLGTLERLVEVTAYGKYLAVLNMNFHYITYKKQQSECKWSGYYFYRPSMSWKFIGILLYFKNLIFQRMCYVWDPGDLILSKVIYRFSRSFINII